MSYGHSRVWHQDVAVDLRRNSTARKIREGSHLRAPHRQISVLDAAVERTGFLVDGRLSYADINLMPILHRLSQAPEGNVALGGALCIYRNTMSRTQRELAFSAPVLPKVRQVVLSEGHKNTDSPPLTPAPKWPLLARNGTAGAS